MNAKKIALFAAALALLAPLSASAAVSLGEPNLNALSQGLAGYWSMDGNTINWNTGTIQDLSGNGNTGTLLSMSPASQVAGKIGGALTFNGSQGISIAPSSSLDISGDFTLAAWVYYNGNDSDYRTFIDGGDDSWNLSVQSGTGKAMIGETGVADICVGATVLSVGWHYLVGTRAGDTFTVYVDGKPDATCTSSVSYTTTNTKYIGRSATGSFWLSKLDEVRIYDRALSQQEVQMLYEMGTFDLGNMPATNSSFSIDQIGTNSGLIAYWPLDGNTTNWNTDMTNDVSGNGYNLQLVSMSTTSSPVAGKIGGALLFNGSNGYAVSGSLGSPPSSISVAFWFKPNSTSDQSILDFQDSANPITSYHMTVVGIYQGDLYASYWGTTDITGPALSTNTWYHVVLTYNGSTETEHLYLNGVLRGSDTGQAWSAPGTLYVYLAQRQQGCSFYTECGDNATFFDGTIDDVRVYNRTLSQQEISDLYTAGQVNIGHSDTTLNTGINSGLVGYWTFDGPTINWRTDTVADMSGNGHTGTLVNMSTSSSPVAGKIGQALSFNDSNSYISIANFPGSTLSNYTISFWAKPSACGTITEMQFFDSSGDNVGVSCKTGGILANWAGGSYPITGNGVVVNGTWMYITVTSQGGNSILYVNGKVVATGEVSNSFTSGTAYIGQVNGGGRYYGGIIDDFRVYDRALSVQEVQELYQMGL